MTAQIEWLRPGEGNRWRSIRLRALAEAPSAFGTTHAEAVQWSAAQWEMQVAQFATFVAVLDGHDVGVARGVAHPNRDVRELISLWVAPGLRRHGVGAQLVDSVAAWAKATGATELVLDVVMENAPALALYERNGFLRSGAAMGECAAGEVRLVRAL